MDRQGRGEEISFTSSKRGHDQSIAAAGCDWRVMSCGRDTPRVSVYLPRGERFDLGLRCCVEWAEVMFLAAVWCYDARAGAWASLLGDEGGELEKNEWHGWRERLKGKAQGALEGSDTSCCNHVPHR